MTRAEIALKARRFYSFDRPYHNYGHALHVLSRAETLMQRCQQYGIEFDESAVLWAALYHDANYGADFKDLGFETMEAMSAAITFDEMRRFGETEICCNIAAQAIRATHWAEQTRSVEDKILRAADLGGLGGDPELYLTERDQVLRESGTKDEWQFTCNNLRFLAGYVWQRIELTPEYFDSTGRSAWHIGVARNFSLAYLRCAFETGHNPKIVLDIEAVKSPASPKIPDQDVLVFGLDNCDNAKSWIVTQIQNIRSPLGPIEIILPGELASIPVPDNFFDEIVASESFLPKLTLSEKRELLRVSRNPITPIRFK